MGAAWPQYYLLAALAMLVTCATIVAVHRESFRTLVSAHGLLHSAIAQRFEGSWRSFGRPENPFFAGERLPYYWFYQYVAARIGAIAGVHPLVAFECLGLLAVGIVWFSAAALGRRLGWGPGPSLAIGFLAFAGTNALGSLILLVKLASGKRWPADDGAYLWGLTHPVMGLMRVNDPGALYGPLINFFLNNSSRSLALALSLALLPGILRYLDAADPWVLGGLVLASAACSAVSPIIGLLAALALSFALVCDWAVALSSRTPRSHSLHAAAALVVGCALASPTYYHLFARTAQPGVVLGLRPDLIVTIGFSAGPLLALALVGLLQLPSQRRFLAMLLGASVGLLLGNTVLRIPGSNESNLFHVAGFMLAVPAAGVFVTIGGWAPLRRRIVGGLLLMLLASTPAVVLWAYWRRPPVPLALEGASLRRTPASAPRAMLYDWIRTSTASDAVFVIDDQVLRSTVLGNVPEFPALSDRVLFVASDPDYIVQAYPDASRRRRIATTLVAGSALSPDDRAYVAALRRPVFVLVENAPADVLVSLRTRYGTPEFDDQQTAVFRLPG